MIVASYLLFVATFWEFVVRIANVAVVITGIVVTEHADVEVVVTVIIVAGHANVTP